MGSLNGMLTTLGHDQAGSNNLLSDLFIANAAAPSQSSQSLSTGLNSLGLPFFDSSSSSSLLSTTQHSSLSTDFDLNVQPFGVLSSSSTSSLPVLASSTSSSSSSSSSNFSPEVATTFSAPSTQSIGSPLGLFDGSNGSCSTDALSQFLVSPMFSDVDGSLPLEFPPLFPDADLAATIAQLTASTTAPIPPIPLSMTSNSSSPVVPSTAPVSKTVQATSKPSSSTRTPKPKQPLSRIGSTPTVLPLDAPIQPREYLLPSATSRKRKTTAAEREIAKRLAAVAGEESSSSSSSDTPVAVDIPQDLVDAVEKKRLQNTLAARKSRAKKQEKMGELEEKNKVLVAEKEALLQKVRDYEQMLKALGVVV
ncbi:hypothetical protein T439DRAFT_322949 [Meredithblackwellia eburnea MCA 4105]